MRPNPNAEVAEIVSSRPINNLVNNYNNNVLDLSIRCRVVENAASELSSPIFVMSARDRDDPPYNRLEYSLRDDLGGLFRINSTTGEIFAARPLDREKKAEYELEVWRLFQSSLTKGQCNYLIVYPTR